MANKMTWDGAADQHLLLSILTTHDIKIDFDLVATHLGCTPRAVQERLKKLRKMAAEHATSDPAVVSGPKTPTQTKTNTKTQTPAKTKTPTKTKGAPGGADAAVPSPKKRKIATPKAKGGKAGVAVAGASPGAEGEDEEVKVKMEMVGEEEMEEGPGGPEMSAVVKEEDPLGTDHDSGLYDARVGVPAGEI